ncbi:MAG: metal-dependent hydrolase [Alphaproteobacteria bacterium]|nr:metal-dependent hydrolase [Alphaproteobacteria bacterium]
MRWVSHMLIGGSVCSLWQPAWVPVAVLGATAPDWLEWIGRKHLPLARAHHRGATHNLLSWLLLGLAGCFMPRWGDAILAFAVGGLLHWFGDALTVSGAPLTWWSPHRSTLFGGRLRQGGKTERAIAIGVAGLCALVWSHRLPWGEADFNPFVMPWQQHYRAGLIDAAEWRRHRFSPF